MPTEWCRCRKGVQQPEVTTKYGKPLTYCKTCGKWIKESVDQRTILLLAGLCTIVIVTLMLADKQDVLQGLMFGVGLVIALALGIAFVRWIIKENERDRKLLEARDRATYCHCPTSQAVTVYHYGRAFVECARCHKLMRPRVIIWRRIPWWKL